ncbi:MAG: hypothetical protein P8P30_07750 [Rickettsiales bacterium]|nr:hypothetical protein [Rickettsiales bacterium]
MALCTGARLSEVTLLRNDEIREVSGHWFMLIQHREDRGIKTAASANL